LLHGVRVGPFFFAVPEVIMQLHRIPVVLVALLAPLAIGLAGCDSMGGMGGSKYPSAYSSAPTAINGSGVVQAIDVVPRESSGLNVGTVTGALAGGLLGHQIGEGSGNTAATLAGAAGGALAGREVEKRMRGNQQAYRITLRMDNGALQTITQEAAPGFRIGDRVNVSNGVVGY
jgi:outer membrane lipoprotein SlyB